MKIEELFYVKYGINMDLNKCEITNDTEGVNFVSRTSLNNGVSACIKRIENREPHPAGVISCATGGSVLSTFVQPKPFYCGRDIYILTPKDEMNLNEKLFYCLCIKNNAYKYDYGRQANKTLKKIKVPNEIPSWVYDTKIKYFKTNNSKIDQKIKPKNWKEIPIGSLFDIKRGKRLTKLDRIKGNIPFVTAGYENQGIAENIGNKNIELFQKNITIDMFGNAFFRDYYFACDDNILVLIGKNDILVNKYVAIFITTIINCDKYRYAYGRQYRQKNFLKQNIKLPVTQKGDINFTYMKNYIKSLPFADRL